MAVTVMPINQVTVPARQNRQAFAALMMPGPGPLRTRSGFRPGGEPVVTVTAATWSVDPFSAIVDTGQSSTTGPYLVASDATETGNMTPADPTYARKDILYIQLDDGPDEDASGQRRGRVLPLTGVASANPIAPDIPARSLLVGTIDVPKDGNGAPVFTPSRLTTVAAGGILPVQKQADLDAIKPFAYNGMVAFNAADGKLYLYRSGQWQRVDWDDPWGEIGGRVNSGSVAGIAATETVVQDSGPVTLLAGRRYRFWAQFSKLPSAANVNWWHFSVRRGNATTGTVVTELTLKTENNSFGGQYSVMEAGIGITATVTETWYVTCARLTGADTLTVSRGPATVTDVGPTGRLNP